LGPVASSCEQPFVINEVGKVQEMGGERLSVLTYLAWIGRKSKVFFLKTERS